VVFIAFPWEMASHKVFANRDECTFASELHHLDGDGHPELTPYLSQLLDIYWAAEQYIRSSASYHELVCYGVYPGYAYRNELDGSMEAHKKAATYGRA